MRTTIAKNRRRFLKNMASGLGAMALPVGVQAATRRLPNVVFILIDDYGWRDTGCYGSTFYETPNIDQFAREGMRFTDAYAAAAVCSPTRAALMSGKHPARLHITDWIPGNRSEKKLAQMDFEQQLPLSEVTMAEAFRQGGYRTGFIGKWHLGADAFYPQHQGFEINIAGNHRGAPSSGYFSPWKLQNLKDGEKGEYLPDHLSRKATEYMEKHRDEPFFLYLCHYTVHSPVQAKQETIEKYKKKAAALPKPTGPLFVAEGPDGKNREIQNHPTYAAMVEHMDENVGRVLAKVKALGLEDDTLIVFTSDNGGQSILFNRSTPWGSNRPLRAGKGWHYEGGIRVPLIMKWPGKTSGGSECAVPVYSADLYPTLLEMAGLPLRPKQHLDGLSLVPLLQQKGGLNREAIFWHYPHYHGSAHRPSGAVRAGDYKLVEFFEDMRVELYNLKDDLEESCDLSKTMPKKTKELRDMLHAWRKSVGADMPKPNPKWEG